MRCFKWLDEEPVTVDVLIANAGISSRCGVLDLPAERWREMLAVNLDGVFHCAQEAGRRMVGDERDGVILMMGSTNGITGHPGYAHYNASKAGVIALAKTMALELAARVRVNAICPGYVLTEMQRAEYTDEMLEKVNRGLPLRRQRRPQRGRPPLPVPGLRLGRLHHRPSHRHRRRRAGVDEAVGVGGPHHGESPAWWPLPLMP